MIGGNEPARLLDLRLLPRLKQRAVGARNRNCVLPKDCAGRSENNRNRTPAAELDFGSEANHAVSDYQTVFVAVPTVKQNQPLLCCSGGCVSRKSVAAVCDRRNP